MAPLAPTIGAYELGSLATCTAAASEPAHQIEEEEAAVPEQILDPAPEDPQVEQVSREMQQPAMDEHGGDRREPDDLTGRPRLRGAAQELARHQPPGVGELGERAEPSPSAATSETSSAKTSALATIRQTTTSGVLRLGTSSRSGSMRGVCAADPRRQTTRLRVNAPARASPPSRAALDFALP